MAERYKVSGLTELRDTMLKLPKELRGRPLRDALFSAAKVIRDEAIRLAPRDTGRLAMNIVVSPAGANEKSMLDEGVVVVVRQRGKKKDPYNAFYARFVEFGHATRLSKALRKVQHRAVKMREGAISAVRFIPARPFMRPAFESRKHEALAVFSIKFKEALEKAVAKVNRVR